MKKLLLLSDVHATSRTPMNRKDNILKTLRRKLIFILEYANKNNCIILQAGDFCDASRDWKLLFELINIFKKYPKVKIYSIIGQHDLYMRSSIEDNPTTFAALVNLGYIKLLNNKHLILEDGKVNIYGTGWGEKVPKPKPKADTNILVIHAPIYNKPLFPGHRYIDAGEFIKKKKYNLILAGDIHRQFVKITTKNVIINTGPLLRKEATEYNLTHKPCFYTWEYPGAIEKKTIPHEPYEKVLNEITSIENLELREEGRIRLIKKLKKGLNKIVKKNSRQIVNIILESEKNRLVKKVIKKAINDEIR